jgi:hypothetical protein
LFEGDAMKLTFKIELNSGAAYFLFVVCITAYAFAKSTTFDAYATALFGALVWYTGRRAYKEVKLNNLTMTRDTMITKEEEKTDGKAAS